MKRILISLCALSMTVAAIAQKWAPVGSVQAVVHQTLPRQTSAVDVVNLCKRG